MQKLVHNTLDSHAAVGTPRVRPVPAHVHTYVVAAVLALAVPSLADGATRYVADTGNDGPNCGLALTTACRSITQAIALADAGDIILVGPGRYGDLNRNGVLGDIAGEETGSPGCGCVLSINKNVIVMSSAGAAVTLIDGRRVGVIQNVLLITIGGEFGRPGKGFTVTGTPSGSGIVIDSANVMVRGNQVTRIPAYRGTGYGIITVNDTDILIEGNQVMNFAIGISGRGAATVSKNQVMANNDGIRASGGRVVSNVVTGNDVGMSVMGPTQVTTNAVYANDIGIQVHSTFSGVITKNNMFGNGYGLANMAVAGLVATNNYWGVTTGPGAPPADDVRDYYGGTTTTSPFATKPFAVKVVKP